MAKKKPEAIVADGDVPPMPVRGREVIYIIVVPGCDDTIKIERARRELHQHGIRESPIHIDTARHIVSVPRLFTPRQGDLEEQYRQRAIQNALPDCLIDVKDWTPAPGYPQGELGAIEGATK